MIVISKTIRMRPDLDRGLADVIFRHLNKRDSPQPDFKVFCIHTCCQLLMPLLPSSSMYEWEVGV